MKKFALLLIPVFLLSACGGADFKKTPVDNFIRDMDNVDSYSILLYDMNVEGTFFKDYMHQYRIVKTQNGEVEEETTRWYEVPENFFMQHQEHMGMEIAAKSEDGKVSRTASPPGYSNYVGNPQYGHWVNRGGDSFWEFYGKYALLSSMFNMMSFPVRRSYYDTYRGSYYGRQPYYGPSMSGRRMYGTNSTYNSRVKPNTTWQRSASASSFKNRVRRSVSPSSRSGSRYSSSGSIRSRGGGFGK
ncbi:MAG: hypothetical protein ACNS62_11530 [Candidatus Cyclobacteriaceae bacterium M3_2C_046]